MGTDPGDCQSLECLPAQYNIHLTLRTEFDEDGFFYREGICSALFLKPGNDVSIYSGPNKDDIRLGWDSDVELPAEVYVNNYLLPSINPDGSEAPVYLEFFRDTVLAPPGAYNVLRVSRAVDLPALVDSIMTPVDGILPVNLTEMDTISIARGFTVRFAERTVPQPVVDVHVYQFNSDGITAQFQTSMAADSSLTISPEILQRRGFSPGTVRVEFEQRYVERKWITPEIRSNFSFTQNVRITLPIVQ